MIVNIHANRLGYKYCNYSLKYYCINCMNYAQPCTACDGDSDECKQLKYIEQCDECSNFTVKILSLIVHVENVMNVVFVGPVVIVVTNIAVRVLELSNVYHVMKNFVINVELKMEYIMIIDMMNIQYVMDVIMIQLLNVVNATLNVNYFLKTIVGWVNVILMQRKVKW